MANHPIALEAYEKLADAYAAHADTKPHNAYYERPATLSLLPDVAGLHVLDAGCGPGVYAEWLVNHGARVVGVDVSPRMVEHARSRIRDNAEFHVADLAQTLPCLDNDAFDVVISALALDYIEDWRVPAREFHRLLRPGGVLVFSVSHPFFDFGYFRSKDYFRTELVSGEWTGFHPVRVRMPAVRRSLQEAINPFLECGFMIERILEPRPTDAFRTADPRHYHELMKQPCFLCIRART